MEKNYSNQCPPHQRALLWKIAALIYYIWHIHTYIQMHTHYMELFFVTQVI